MKLIASILLTVFIALGLEQVKIPSKCFGDSKPPSCSMCHKTKTPVCGEAAGKSAKKDSSTPQCMDCPLCLTMLNQHSMILHTNSSFIERKYTITPTDNITGYHRVQWKPPNVSCIPS